MPRKPFWYTQEQRAAQPRGPHDTAIPPAASVTPLTEHAAATLTRATQRQAHGKQQTARSYPDLLSRLYTQFDALVDEISLSEDAPAKKAMALKDLARCLPLLKAAEDIAKVSVGNRDISQLKDSELDTLVRAAMKSREADSPMEIRENAVGPTRAEKRKNPSQDVVKGALADEDD